MIKVYVLVLSFVLASCSSAPSPNFAAKSNKQPEQPSSSSREEAHANNAKPLHPPVDELAKKTEPSSSNAIGSLGSANPSIGSSLIVDVPELSPLNLGESLEFVYTITASETLTKPVALGLNLENFHEIDPAGDVSFSLDPEEVILEDGESQEIRLSINVGTMAPSIDGLDPLHLIQLTADSDTASEVLADLAIEIEPVITIQMFGGGSKPMSYIPNLREMNFASHEDGLLVRFVNMDPDADNIIHSLGGDIPHGPRDRPMAPASGDQPGGTYEVMIDTDAESARWYSHSYGGVKTNMLFNVAP